MTKTVNFHDLSQLSSSERSRLLTRTEADLSQILPRVQQIIDDVRIGGDKALARFARELDKADLDENSLTATKADFDAAEDTIEPELREAMEFAAGSIERFHRDQMPKEMWLHEIRPGAFAGDRVRPIPSVACYVPRGKGAFPSVALMTTLPAKVAGVKEVAIVTPPGRNGKVDAATLFAARLAGVDKVYKAGGAQAVAAVAYGTGTIPKFAKLIGPGSPWVAAAKRLVAHIIDTGTPAGPSELIVLADETADGRLAGLDLL
ncbi:MAG TPA: histidinol dehydrogenase, partial [Aestuariivirgaceae bacterium]|nr:histidinol dehydrogenase [Aestuariivirgaceae bacterium]